MSPAGLDRRDACCQTTGVTPDRQRSQLATVTPSNIHFLRLRDEILSDIHRMIRLSGLILPPCYALVGGGLRSDPVVARGNDLMIDRVDYHALTDRSVTERIVVRDGSVKRSKFFCPALQPGRTDRFAWQPGFRSVEVFGQEGRPFTLYGNRMIVVGTI